MSSGRSEPPPAESRNSFSRSAAVFSAARSRSRRAARLRLAIVTPEHGASGAPAETGNLAFAKARTEVASATGHADRETLRAFHSDNSSARCTIGWNADAPL